MKPDCKESEQNFLTTHRRCSYSEERPRGMGSEKYVSCCMVVQAARCRQGAASLGAPLRRAICVCWHTEVMGRVLMAVFHTVEHTGQKEGDAHQP